MNATLGSGNAVTGPWIQIYQQTKSLNEFRFPGPSDVNVFIEEHPDSINDPLFFAPDATRFIDFPSNLHENGTPVAFADGAVQLKQWRSSVRNVPVRVSDYPGRTTPLRDPDVSWLSYHSARRTEQHF